MVVVMLQRYVIDPSSPFLFLDLDQLWFDVELSDNYSMQPMEKNHHKTNSFECIINKSIAIINVRTFLLRFEKKNIVETGKLKTLDNTIAKKGNHFEEAVAKLQASVNIIKVHNMTFTKKCKSQYSGSEVYDSSISSK